MKKILLFLIFCFMAMSVMPQTKVITVNAGSDAGRIKNLLGVNIGPDNSVEGYRFAGVSEIRTHDYYGPCDYHVYTNFYNPADSSFNAAFNPDDSANYSWLSTDRKIDSIVQFGIAPYFRLGYSYPPQARPANNPRYPPYDPDGVSFTKFARLCKRTVMHYNAEWNRGRRYNIRYWEVLNEPDNAYIWRGTAADYYKLYRAVSDSLKMYDSTLKVGGPGAVAGTIVTHKKTYYDDFLDYCKTNNVKLDFYSWHLYGRANPWSIKNYADTVRHVMNTYGFVNAESHLNEINRELTANSAFDNTPRGTAYTASVLLTAQECSIDKVFWYRGTRLGALFFADSAGGPNPTWNGYAYKLYNFLVKETPVKLSSTGNEVINFNTNADTTNLMTLAAKSKTGDTLLVLISNYKSSAGDITVRLENLGWTGSDSVALTRYTLQNGAKYTQASSSLSGGNTISTAIQNAASPSVFLLRFVRRKLTGIAGETIAPQKFFLAQNYPNPFNPATSIKYGVGSKEYGDRKEAPIGSGLGTLGNRPRSDRDEIGISQQALVSLRVYDVLGREVATLVNEERAAGNYEVKFDAVHLSSGTYFYELRAGEFREVKKMILLR